MQGVRTMLEIIAETLEDALAAEAGGATQLDLKSDFVEDGLTPTAGMVEMICSRVGIDVIVMVRNQVSSMILSQDDISIMCADIKLSAERGAAGFLLGAITDKRVIDEDAVSRFIEAADGLPLHFHLAWEMTEDPQDALDTLMRLGIKTARTSGGQALGGKAVNRMDAIKKFRKQTEGRMDIFLAGGVRSDNIARLVEGTGVMHAHAGSSVREPENPKGIVIEEKVHQLRQELDDAVLRLRGSR